MFPYLKILTDEEIACECTFVLVIKSSENFRFFPIDVSTLTFSSMLGNARDIGVKFIGGDVVGVLFHTSSE